MHFRPPAVKRAHAAYVGAGSHQIRTRHKIIAIPDVLERLYVHFGPSAAKRAHAVHVGADCRQIRIRHKIIAISDILSGEYRRFGPRAAERVHAVHVGANSPTLQLSAGSIPDTKLLVVRMSLSGLTGLLVRPLPTACMAKTSGTDYRPHHPDPFHL
ncbi:hypothetical protein B0H14DRAFT_3674884 [Mycena olivaceomarginata]|nr:hypothetical protein B0H14DRAFT_3674884 [Mycena olivaceomarginata]